MWGRNQHLPYVLYLFEAKVLNDFFFYSSLKSLVTEMFLLVMDDLINHNVAR